MIIMGEPFRVRWLQDAAIAVVDSIYSGLAPMRSILRRKGKEVEYIPLQAGEDPAKMYKKVFAETPREALNWRLFFGVFVFGNVIVGSAC